MGLMGRRRRVRRRRVLAAGAVAYQAGKNRETSEEAEYSQDGSYEDQAAVPPAPPAPGDTQPADDIGEIERLAAMHSAGDLTDDEFSAAKAKILGS